MEIREASSEDAAIALGIIRDSAPRIWFHKKEPFKAMDPLIFLERSSLWFRSPGKTPERFAEAGKIIPAELAGGALYRKDGVNSARTTPLTRPHQSDGYEFFLRFEGDPKSGGKDAPILWRAGIGPIADAVKKLNSNDPSKHYLLVEYWYHSAYSLTGLWGIGDHQGDWEGLTALIEIEAAVGGDSETDAVSGTNAGANAGNSANDQLRSRYRAAYYASHERGKWVCASDLKWAQDHPTHPEAFSALGTHATYPQPGSHRTPYLTDQTSRGENWDTWLNIRPLALEPYYGYSGAWGDTAVFSFMTGPLPPGPTFKPMPKPFSDGFLKRCGL